MPDDSQQAADNRTATPAQAPAQGSTGAPQTEPTPPAQAGPSTAAPASPATTAPAGGAQAQVTAPQQPESWLSLKQKHDATILENRRLKAELEARQAQGGPQPPAQQPTQPAQPQQTGYQTATQNLLEHDRVKPWVERIEDANATGGLVAAELVKRRWRAADPGSYQAVFGEPEVPATQPQPGVTQEQLQALVTPLVRQEVGAAMPAVSQTWFRVEDQIKQAEKDLGNTFMSEVADTPYGKLQRDRAVMLFLGEFPDASMNRALLEVDEPGYIRRRNELYYEQRRAEEIKASIAGQPNAPNLVGVPAPAQAAGAPMTGLLKSLGFPMGAPPAVKP